LLLAALVIAAAAQALLLAALVIAAAAQQIHCKNNEFTMRVLHEWSLGD
jgi:hypothetical protein